MNNKKRFLFILGVLLLAMLIAACSEGEQVEVTRIVEVEVPVDVPGPEIEVTRIVETTVEVEVPVGPDINVPFLELWQGSGHANAEAEAFVHWNEDDPAEVPPSCARCHSTPGYIDFIGADGSEAGVVDVAAPIGTVISCEACHNDATLVMTSVTFPSGVEVGDLGPEARCMQCHQGRHSTVSVNESIAEAGLTDDPDAVSEDLGFSNIHYYAAAATQYGTVTMGGYEYDGKSYDSKFDHVEGYDTCVDCHNPHTLEVRFDECTACHQGLETADDLVNVRMAGSLVDYDGDGDLEEGVYFEIEGMRELLYQAMYAYSSEIAGAPIIYNSSSYPYFFTDGNGNGELDDADTDRYATWTPRLAKAAYNYQVSLKDPGRFAHGGKYIIQLLYDSIEDLNSAIAEPVDLTAVRRIDHGHFAGSEEAFRHWDEDGAVPGSCSRCHSAAGLPLFIEQGVTIEQPTANGLNCATCHNDLNTFSRYEVEDVPFPSGAVLTTGDLDSNLCINCHQGRESANSVNNATAGLEDDVVSDRLRFINIHYFAAGASLFGTEAKGAFEYEGQTYLGRNEHVGKFDTCIECHNTHALEVEVAECAECHETVQTKDDLRSIRVNEVDYDGDGDVTEGIASEIDTMRDQLYVAMQAYANGVDGADAILYSSSRYPYFFIDANGNGEVDEGEVGGSETRYGTWTPRLLRAAYNYQYTAKDPGAYAHNGLYIIQVLYDGLVDMGADVSGMTRPEVE